MNSSKVSHNAAIVFDGVRKSFSNAGRTVLAIDELSFSLGRGEYVCILGRSGCGKSTMASLLLGLDRPTAGRISVLGVDPVSDFAKLRGRLASVFQSDRLLPWRTAVENVRLPMEILGREKEGVRVSPAEWLSRLGLQGFENSYPHQLSGGMRQRVALARALVADPDVVVADEAFAHLDEVTGERLRRDFHRLTKTGGKTVVHITHSIDEAIGLGDRILVVGKPGHVLANLTDFANRDRDELRAHILTHLQAPPDSAARFLERRSTRMDEPAIGIGGWAS
jgi:NitT/TauT family transport system ATP-binding protein